MDNPIFKFIEIEKIFLTKIEEAISIKHLSIENHYEDIFNAKLPCIFKLNTENALTLKYIKNDDFKNLQVLTSIIFTKSYCIKRNWIKNTTNNFY